MRSPRLPALALSVAVVPAVLAVPVLTTPRPHAHPVHALIRVLDLGAAANAANTSRFSLVGASWRRGALPSGAAVEVRVRQNGSWSGWNALATSDGGPDAGSAEAERTAGQQTTDPLWAGRADGVEARVVRAGAVLHPAGVHLTLVDPGSSNADGSVTATPANTAEAATVEPRIYTRADWGADESLRRSVCPSGPDYNSTIKVGFVHHTDTPNGYSSSDVPSIIRGIYAYHVKSNGWCDIGYNFLIDRFGRIWEGRYGGITKAVVGAHTGGFNADSFGVSAIGTYTSTQPTSAMLSAYEHLFAWKLGLYFRDPTGTDHLISAGGGTDRWPVGQSVLFHRMSGHRDAGSTTCPGDDLYAKLPTMRSAARALMGSVPVPSGDFSGDLATDPATWDPATGNWHVGSASNSTKFGTTGDAPVPGNYVGDSKTERAVWRASDGRWYVDAPHSSSVQWGARGDVPVPADYNGDGITDRAVWRPSTGRWYVDLPGWTSVQWGARGDVPVPADYTGDGKSEYAVWRPTTGAWFIRHDGASVAWGAPTDIPVPADYDGDGRADRAVWRGSNGGWYVYGGRTLTQWGALGDVPAVGGFAGSAIATPSAYRTSTGRWYVLHESSMVVGGAGYEPLVLPYAVYRAIPQGKLASP
ncbi:MAG: N-acetylmuramoyl-L-alanine amidase [Actinomycetes bacterium]